MAKKIQRSVSVPTGRPAAAEAGPGPARKGRARGRVPSQLVTEFTTQLATLSGAGIPIVKALTILEGQTRPGPFKHVLGELVEDVSGGMAMSEAMAKHAGVFDTLYSSMVKAGESAGVLDAILRRIATFREKAAAMRSKLVGAMVYPAVVAFVAVAVVSAVIVWVIPRFQDIFESFDTELPAITQTLLDVSHFAVHYWYLAFGLPLLLIVLHLFALRRSQGYRYRVHGLMLRVPVLSGVLSKALIANFSRTFGTLIEGVERIRRTVREGEGIARPMGESRVFDDLVVNMVDVGEATGELDSMLLQVADAYEIAVDRRVDALFKLIEPVLLIGMAVVVGFIVVALFMPLMTIMSQLGSG